MTASNAYKGNWNTHGNDRPAYKEIWVAKEIANPVHVADGKVHPYTDVRSLGFDLGQVKCGSVFDKGIWCDDVAGANGSTKRRKALNEVETTKKQEQDDTEKAGSAEAIVESVMTSLESYPIRRDRILAGLARYVPDATQEGPECEVDWTLGGYVKGEGQWGARKGERERERRLVRT